MVSRHARIRERRLHDRHQHVADHYDRHDLADRLRAALTTAGLDGRTLTPKDLAPLDQFHSRGLAATVELAAGLPINPQTRVLDLGSGLGGPSRYLAATFGCHVIGIDLSPAFVEAAKVLADRCGLADHVAYDCADALALPFTDGDFDLVWTQHVAMNIADRAKLYAEAFRVLRPAGSFAIYDVIAGAGGPPHFPVPWSRGPETSFLMTPEAMCVALEAAGFEVRSWINRTEAGIEWFAALQAAQASGPPAALGLHLAMGPDMKEMTGNLGRNLREGRVGLAEVVAVRA